MSTSAPPHPAGLLDADAFPEEVVVAYHERTKHHFHRYAASPGYMDWATQPDPFRRYQGADLVRLPLAKPGRPLPYWQLCLVLLDGISDRAIAGLFGLSRGDDYGTAEREEPELLALVTPGLPSTSPVTPDGRWLILDELCGDDIGFSTFADCVLELCAERFDGYKFEDYGDPAGAQRSAMTADKAEKTCFDILQGKGIGIQLGGQNLTIRLESVRKPLNTLREGKPQFQISPRCEMLRKGFLGRYQYRRVKVSGSAERYHDEPEKNEYSHPHDALQYVATRVFADAVRGWEEQRKQWSRPIEELYAARMKEMRGNIV